MEQKKTLKYIILAIIIGLLVLNICLNTRPNLSIGVVHYYNETMCYKTLKLTRHVFPCDLNPFDNKSYLNSNRYPFIVTLIRAQNDSVDYHQCIEFEYNEMYM